MKQTILLLALLSGAIQSVLAGQTPDTLGKIKKSGSMTVAFTSDALPFSFLKEGVPNGYSIDICNEIINDLKVKLDLPKLKVTWLGGNTPESLDRVASGKADMDCGTTSITLSRQEHVDFSNEIFVDSAGVLVLKQSGIGGLISLGNKKVAVIPGTTTEKRLIKALERKRVKADLVPVDSGDAGFNALTEGTVDAYAGDRISLTARVLQSKDPTLYTSLGQEFSVDPYALALPRGDADLRLAVNRSLARIYRGPVIEEIFERWFINAEPGEMLWAVYLLNAYPD